MIIEVSMMETISIINRGSIHKFVDDVFIDTIENIYALCDLKISYYGVSIAYNNTGQLKKYKRGEYYITIYQIMN